MMVDSYSSARDEQAYPYSQVLTPSTMVRDMPLHVVHSVCANHRRVEYRVLVSSSGGWVAKKFSSFEAVDYQRMAYALCIYEDYHGLIFSSKCRVYRKTKTKNDQAWSPFAAKNSSPNRDEDHDTPPNFFFYRYKLTAVSPTH